MVLIDSYSEANQDSNYDLKQNHPSGDAAFSACMQSFTNLNGVYKITSVKWYLRLVGNPTGNAHACLYAHAGVYGVNSTPGALLATSDNFDVSTLGGAYALETFTFSGAEQVQMTALTNYVITYENPAAGIDAANYVRPGLDASAPSHGGNAGNYRNGAWTARAHDMCFYVYGDLVSAVASRRLLVGVGL
jgi:hypothetical protein